MKLLIFPLLNYWRRTVNTHSSKLYVIVCIYIHTEEIFYRGLTQESSESQYRTLAFPSLGNETGGEEAIKTYLHSENIASASDISSL